MAELEREKDQPRQANLTLAQRDQALRKAAKELQAANETLEMFGIERLCGEILASGECSPDELCDRVWRKIHAFCACPEDDVSLVVIRFEGVRM